MYGTYIVFFTAFSASMKHKACPKSQYSIRLLVQLRQSPAKNIKAITPDSQPCNASTKILHNDYEGKRCRRTCLEKFFRRFIRLSGMTWNMCNLI